MITSERTIQLNIRIVFQFPTFILFYHLLFVTIITIMIPTYIISLHVGIMQTFPIPLIAALECKRSSLTFMIDLYYYCMDGLPTNRYYFKTFACSIGMKWCSCLYRCMAIVAWPLIFFFNAHSSMEVLLLYQNTLLTIHICLRLSSLQ